MNSRTGATQRLPDFLVIGAMKCATTTLHEQLARQPGIFMTREKEPNFFSDDALFAQGIAWYSSLFQGARPDDLLGESSTHYTKLPTHPAAVSRIAAALPRVKLIYVMRHPIERLISHYRHECTVGRIDSGTTFEEAIAQVPELIDYGRYAYQLTPYLETFGSGRILPVFLKRLVDDPQAEFERIGRFLAYAGTPRWDHRLGRRNAGELRLRHSPLRQALVNSRLLTPLRHRLISPALSDRLKSFWIDRSVVPSISPDIIARLREVFDADLALLGQRLGVDLDCANFKAVTHRPRSNGSSELDDQRGFRRFACPDLEKANKEASANSNPGRRGVRYTPSAGTTCSAGRSGACRKTVIVRAKRSITQYSLIPAARYSRRFSS